MTDLGALDVASDEGGFTFNASDEYYYDPDYGGSFFLTDIEGIENDAMAYTSWFIYVDGELAPLGLGQNLVEDGDQVTFLYAPYTYIAEDPYIEVDLEHTKHIVNIDVEVIDTYTAIENLQDYINSLDAPQYTKCILTCRLDGVVHSLEHGRDQIAIIKLNSFIRAVERHESWGNLSSEEADYIIGAAEDIIELIQNS
jgi:hypothetical protein